MRGSAGNFSFLHLFPSWIFKKTIPSVQGWWFRMGHRPCICKLTMGKQISKRILYFKLDDLLQQTPIPNSRHRTHRWNPSTCIRFHENSSTRFYCKVCPEVTEYVGSLWWALTALTASLPAKTQLYHLYFGKPQTLMVGSWLEFDSVTQHTLLWTFQL